MLIDGSVSMVSFILIFGLLVTAASILIPMYGYMRKRWKGVALGCLIQPIACAVIIALVFGGIVAFEIHSLNRQIKSAMVAVKTVEQGKEGLDTLEWYLKDDEECIRCKGGHSSRYDLYDVIRLDSVAAGVSVDDRIVVRFDLKNQQATATDYDEPIEVLNVDWDKVKAYFNP